MFLGWRYEDDKPLIPADAVIKDRRFQIPEADPLPLASLADTKGRIVLKAIYDVPADIYASGKNDVSDTAPAADDAMTDTDPVIYGIMDPVLKKLYIRNAVSIDAIPEDGIQADAGRIDASPFITWKDDIDMVSIETSWKPSSTARLFQGLDRLVDIDGLENLDLSSVTDMSYMFAGCSSLNHIDLSASGNTGSLKNASHMFDGCKALYLCDIRNMDTKVADVTSMFDECSRIAELILGDGFSFTGTGTAAVVPATADPYQSDEWIRDFDHDTIYTAENMAALENATGD